LRFGRFDDFGREYVIERPDTPRPWSNYLGSRTYGAIITNNAGGYSFYRSAGRGRFMRYRANSVPPDQPGRYFYLRDRDDGEYWSATWQPVGKPLDAYASTCRFGTGYAIIESTYRDVRSQSTYFVPLGRNFELWVLRLENCGRRPRKLRLFTYLEFASAWELEQDQVNLQYSQYISRMDVVDGMLRHAVNDHLDYFPDDFGRKGQGRWSYMGLVGAEVTGYETDREAFLGPYRTYANPVAVERGACTNSLAVGDNACGTMQTDLDLAPGESRELMVILGVGKAELEGKQALAEFDTTDKARAALEQLKAYWKDRLGTLACRTPDAPFDSMVNVWGAYNRLVTFDWSRAASLVYHGHHRDGLGYRDTVQDLVSSFSAVCDEARDRLELMLTGQYSTGGAMPVVQPFTHAPGAQSPPTDPMAYRADDCMWLFDAVPAYVAESGDVGFYGRMLPYADAGGDTVLGHLRRAIEFSFAHRGERGLPCGLSADWNDCIEFGGTGESVFVAFQLRHALRVYLDVCTRLDEPEQSAWARQKREELDAALDAFAWDGAWYRRGTMKDGALIGSASCEEGRIFLNTQSWAVISGYADAERGREAMDAAHDQLATQYGLRVCAPPFRRTSVETILAVLMNPGQKENGSIFSHPQGWAVMAEAMLGRGDRAYAYHRAHMPAAQNDIADVRQIEPYVHCQSTHGPDSPRHGASRIPWLTGTATWAYVAGTQYVLGVRPEVEGLRIDPCIPPAWEGFTVRRVFRGATYEITVRNPDGVCKGVREVTVDGAQQADNLIAPAPTGATMRVEATLGPQEAK